VHNHSMSVCKLFSKIMPEGFSNLSPAEVFADYIRNSDVAPSLHDGTGLLVCAPDKGAREFSAEVHCQLEQGSADLLFIDKQRSGERNVSSFIDPLSPCPQQGIAGKDVIVFDDMVRTGTTIKECCRLLKQAGAGRVIFCVTHFYPSSEGRENLYTNELDEIVTTNTLPSVLNRDMQGRLRRKLTVLKLEKWVTRHLLRELNEDDSKLAAPYYTVDMSSKNPRSATRHRHTVGHLAE